MTQRNALHTAPAAPPLLHWARGHLSDQPVVSAATMEWGGFRLTTMRETEGDVVLPPLERDTLVLSVEGSPRHVARIDGQEVSGAVPPGMVAALPRGAQVASHWLNHDELQTFHIVEFSPEIFQTYAPEIANDDLMRGHLALEAFSERPTFARLIRLLARENDVTERRGTLFAETVVRLMAFEIASVLWTCPPRNLNATPVSDMRVRRAIDYIEAHFCRDISITEIAAAAGLSQSQLGAAFQRQTGTSPYSYVIGRRLDRARELLAASDLPIAHVALEAGFCDQAHLTRLCRARLGKTPRQIRQG